MSGFSERQIYGGELSCARWPASLGSASSRGQPTGRGCGEAVAEHRRLGRPHILESSQMRCAARSTELVLPSASQGGCRSAEMQLDSGLRTAFLQGASQDVL